jgi:hypothetical protein
MARITISDLPKGTRLSREALGRIFGGFVYELVPTKGTVIFSDGERGKRPPTGSGIIVTTYRSGTGSADEDG